MADLSAVERGISPASKRQPQTFLNCARVVTVLTVIMFCPSCGSEERQATQFCRACGLDLRAVRMSIERPDSITASAVSARDEIGRALAEKIREVEDAHELKKVAEDVLPQIEKFLETYEEKRLRRMRTGVITAAGGLGVCILGLVLSAATHSSDGEILGFGLFG